MRVINTNMLADKQRKLLDLKLFTNIHLFWGNTQLLKMARVSKKWYPIEKSNTQLIKKAWVFTQLAWKLSCFTDDNWTGPDNCLCLV